MTPSEAVRIAAHESAVLLPEMRRFLEGAAACAWTRAAAADAHGSRRWLQRIEPELRGGL